MAFLFYVIVLKLTVKREVLKQIPKVIWHNHKASIKFIGHLIKYYFKQGRQFDTLFSLPHS